jgi:L-fuculose-phosphate aldolase
MTDLANYRQEIVEAADHIARSGIMTKSLHGNLSQRVPGGDTFLLTAGGSLGSVQPEDIALFDFKGELLDGTVSPVGAEIIQMHAVVYRTRPEFTSVVHTHSPFATGFACAGQSIPAAYEALIRMGALDGVPVASYGPRGSEQSVENIAAVLNAHEAISSLLLENHGVLAFGVGVEGAVRANMVTEEAAEILLYASSLGGAKAIPAAMIQATRARAASFVAAGSYRSDPPRAG